MAIPSVLAIAIASAQCVNYANQTKNEKVGELQKKKVLYLLASCLTSSSYAYCVHLAGISLLGASGVGALFFIIASQLSLKLTNLKTLNHNQWSSMTFRTIRKNDLPSFNALIASRKISYHVKLSFAETIGYEGRTHFFNTLNLQDFNQDKLVEIILHLVSLDENIEQQLNPILEKIGQKLSQKYLLKIAEEAASKGKLEVIQMLKLDMNDDKIFLPIMSQAVLYGHENIIKHFSDRINSMNSTQLLRIIGKSLNYKPTYPDTFLLLPLKNLEQSIKDQIINRAVSTYQYRIAFHLKKPR